MSALACYGASAVADMPGKLGISVLLVGPSEAEFWSITGMLTALGCQAAHLSSADEAIEALQARPPKLLLVDGRIDGAPALCARAVQAGSLVIVLARTADEQEHVAALDAGADDVIQMPVPLEVLAARTRSLVRRAQSGGPQTETEERPPGWSVDVSRRFATSRTGVTVPLPYQQAVLLQLLISSRAKVLTASKILTSPGFERMSEDSVRTSMHRLRRRLMKVDPQDPIRTLYGRGYAYVGHLNGSIEDGNEGGAEPSSVDEGPYSATSIKASGDESRL